MFCQQQRLTDSLMTELILDRQQRLELRAQGHHLPVTVLLGAQGFTPAVLREIDRALTAHGLIKVRVPDDDREVRLTVYREAAEQLGAARVQMIGKILLLFRPIPDEDDAKPDKAPAKPGEGGRKAAKPEKPAKAAKPAKTAKPAARKASGEKTPARRRPQRGRTTKKAALS